MSGGYTHVLRVRAAGRLDPEALAGRHAALPGPGRAPAGIEACDTLWAERVPYAAGTPAAARRAAASAAFPVSAAQGLRAELLHYADGPTDLILTAHRAFLDRRSLYRLAAALLVQDETAPAWSPRTTPFAPPPTELARWAVTGRAVPDATVARGPDSLALPPELHGDPEPEAWLAALARAAARYQRDAGPLGLAAIVPAPRHTHAAGTLGSFDTLVHRVVDPEDPAAVASESRAVPVAAGLVFDIDDPDASAALAYRGWLTPPFPLTFGIGPRRLHIAHDPRIDPSVAADFAAELLAQLSARPAPPLRSRAAAPATQPPSGSHPPTIHAAFAAQTATHPDAVAVSCEDERITYRALAARADALAHGLHARGVRRGDRVGLCLERSIDLVAAMLAILQCGAAYVPMDPVYPTNRLAFTTADAGLRAVVTTRAGFPAPPGLPIVSPDELAADSPDAPVPAASAAAAPASEGGSPSVGSGDPAYVIYTSGSTGRPKGVVVPHANVLALLEATRGDFGLDDGDVWTLFHSAAFDFSVWEIWGSLLTGARLVLVPYWVARSAEDFLSLLAEEEVTVLSQTPSAFTQLAEAERLRPCRLAVRLVVFGGEALDARMLTAWFDRHPESACRVVNMYGITETTVHVTAETVTRGSALAGSRSVGRALPGWYVRVLDESGDPVPVGAVGEICVGGAGLALGYLNRPGLTADRFRAAPQEPGRRLYRSGDKGRLLPDGTLEHHGRIDSQVKVRGYRIELDEIRNVLLEAPGVTASAVVLEGDPADPAAQRLAAYAVLADTTAAAVLAHAARILPEYMVPASVTSVERMPLTANGKIDTARLAASSAPATPATESAQASTAAVPAAPESADELAGSLREVWSTVLGGEVGLDDDFFALGGNSLLAMRIAARVRERALPPIPVIEIYRHPTVRSLAAATRAAHAD